MQTAGRKKILFLITKSTLGGAQQYVYDLATHLNPEQFEVLVAAGGKGDLIDQLHQAGIKTVSIGSLQRDVSPLQDLRSIIELFRLIKHERPDILHLNSTKAGSLGALLGRILRVKKVIFTAHGWAFNEDRPFYQRFIIKALHWVTILLTHKTIVVSNGAKAQMDWPLVQTRMLVIHLGRDIQLPKRRNEARGIIETKVTDNAVGLSEFHDDIWMGTIAELHPIKRLDRAIDAVASLVLEFPNLRFVIIHDGQLREQLHERVHTLGLEQHVFFTGMIPNAARLLSALDLFVLPSKSEAFGYVLIEAALAKVPVVATAVGGVTDIITNNDTGLLVPPDDTVALTFALRSLLRNKQLRSQLAQRNFENATHFTLTKMVQKTVAVYSQEEIIPAGSVDQAN